MIQVAYLALGSVAGGLARYFMDGAVGRAMGSSFPFGTFAVNILGCFLIGFFSALTGERFSLDPNAKLLFMTGFCGAFTTFSAFMLDSDNLLKDGQILKVFLNVFLSLAVGFIVFRLGVFLGKLA